MSSKAGQIESLQLEIHPFDCWKSPVWLCYQHYLFSFNRIFLKLADKVDMDEVWDVCEKWPDKIILLRILSLWLFDFVLSITCSVLVGSSLNLQIRWTWMKSWMSLKTGQIGSLILESRPLDCWEKPLFDFVISITHLVSIGSSWNFQIRWPWMKSVLSLKSYHIKSFVLRVTSPWFVKKKTFFFLLYLQHNLFIFDQIFLKLADKMPMDEVLDEFENSPDQIIYFRGIYFWPCHQK